MNTPIHPPRRAAGFTLIELLVVISIIGLLAAVVIPIAGAAIRSSRLKRASAELHQLQTVIDRYQAQKGFYPPDNTNNPAMSQLFYELTGTYLVGDTFHRINGIENIPQAGVGTVFYVGGFLNSSPVSDLNNQAEVREAEARNFWPGIESGKYATYITNGVPVVLLGLSLDGPNNLTATNNNASLTWNPWHYNSSNPTNNPGRYDLWVDLLLKNKVVRVCNWSDEPIVVTNIVY